MATIIILAAIATLIMINFFTLNSMVLLIILTISGIIVIGD